MNNRSIPVYFKGEIVGVAHAEPSKDAPTNSGSFIASITSDEVYDLIKNNKEHIGVSFSSLEDCNEPWFSR
jgi:hypothetical protein